MTVRTITDAPAADAAGAVGLPGAWPPGCRRPQGTPTWQLAAGHTRHQYRELHLLAAALIHQQPSPNTQRAAARRIARTILNLAEDIAQTTEKEVTAR